jgi:branched-chain amino acid transport system substrate-binding protein
MKSIHATLAGLAIAAASALASPFAFGQDIIVGVILATTGPGSAVGIPERNELALWPTEFAGHRIRTILQDDRSDPTAATSIARRMATDDKVDVIVGGSLTPGSLALSALAKEVEVPFLALAPTILTEENRAWSFTLPPTTDVMASAIFRHMDRAHVKSVGYIGFSDVWGDQWFNELKQYAAKSGVTITDEERYGRADTSVSGQVLKLIASKPDVILVGGTSSAAGLVQKALVENNFKGVIYHTHGAATKDFLRIAGKSADGAILPAGPSTVAEALPADNLTRAPGIAFAKPYEEKYGVGTRTPFAAHMSDAALVLAKAVPIALQKAQPGTPAFRLALKQAIESIRELPAAQGVLNFSATNHNGVDDRSRVLVTARDGEFRYLPE